MTWLRIVLMYRANLIYIDLGGIYQSNFNSQSEDDEGRVTLSGQESMLFL